MLLYGVGFFVIAPYLVAFLGEEFIRWNECYDDCDRLNQSNHRLLSSSMCNNLFERHTLGKAAEDACEKAERELGISVIACSIRSFWMASGPRQLYLLLIAYPIMIFVLIGASVIYTIYELFSSYNRCRLEKQTAQLYTDALDRLDSWRAPTTVSFPVIEEIEDDEYQIIDRYPLPPRAPTHPKLHRFARATSERTLRIPH
jgi:hypothetical protein